MPASHLADTESPADSGDLDAALRALHAATIHLDQAAAGPDGKVLVARSRKLVRQAASLVSAATRLHGSSAALQGAEQPL